MKARRAIAAAAVSTIAATAGVIGVGTASAATPQPFCVGGLSLSVCAIAEGGNPVFMPRGAIHVTDWLYNGVNHPGQIQQAGTGLCMQLDHNAGNVVIEAACNGASYQKWNPYYIGSVVVYASEWDQTQCLTYNEDLARLDTVDCTGAWYQNFPGN